MKQKVFTRLSVISLVLTVVSAITAAVLPKNEERKQTGGLVASMRVEINQLTCTRDAEGPNCSWTLTLPGDNGHFGKDSRTTTNDNGTSLITNAFGVKVVTITTGGIHTSQN